MDTVLYNDYLPEFREMCLEGELSWKDYANIYDRDLMLRGIPQEYGTQFIETENRYLILYKHIQEDQLNENRLAIGLEPIDVHQKLKLK
ncbi:MAG: hypothetical protein KJO50_11590 [Bacteroidia bacterium]|nr:hypothetical protein [Bacteroidia bacterium]